eukprot:GHVL01022305.1.p1 GENE.GHVL01022305.1~~GHVL01022305.1.p1  ORF type:complete len:306 (+),score=48.72 GHVL01022305.1:620-1537(+)
MGTTELGFTEILEAIHQLGLVWTPERYAMIGRNCCHFADDFCKFLVSRPIPESINALASYFNEGGANGTTVTRPEENKTVFIPPPPSSFGRRIPIKQIPPPPPPPAEFTPTNETSSDKVLVTESASAAVKPSMYPSMSGELESPSLRRGSTTGCSDYEQMVRVQSRSSSVNSILASGAISSKQKLSTAPSAITQSPDYTSAPNSVHSTPNKKGSTSPYPELLDMDTLIAPDVIHTILSPERHTLEEATSVLRRRHETALDIDDDRLANMLELGFGLEESKCALRQCHNNVEEAVSFILKPNSTNN